MTFFLGDANIHNLPPAVVAQDATQKAAQLRDSFGRLSAEIVQVVVNAVLTALGLQSLIPVIGNTNNQIQNIANQTNAIVGGLQGSLRGLLPALIDNFDGSGTFLSGFVNNGDGSGTFTAVNNSVNSLVNNVDGSLSSVASFLSSFGDPVGVNQYAVGSWQTLLGNTGLSSANQLVTSLRGVLPAVIDNGDGSGIITAASNLVANFDGSASVIAPQIANSIGTFIDNLDGSASAIAHIFQNAAASAASFGNSVSTVVAALQRTAVGTGSEFTSSPVNATVLFNQYANSSSLPNTFITNPQIVSGTGTASVGIVGGVATWNGTNTGTANESVAYNLSTATDYQTVSVVFSAVNQTNSTSTNPAYIFARTNSGNFSALAEAKFSNGTAFLLGASGSQIASVAHNLVAGDTYTLVAGTTVGLTNLELLHNGQILLSATDTSSFSSLIGPGYRLAGFQMNSSGPSNSSASISSFSFGDDTAIYPVGSGFRAFCSRTSPGSGVTPSPSTWNSNSLLYLPASCLDSIQWNTPDITFTSSTNTVTISIPGWYEVTVSTILAFTVASTLGAGLWHNGIFAQAGPSYGGANTETIQASFTVFCAAGDTLTPGIYFNGGSFSFAGESVGAGTFFSVSLTNCGTLS